MDGRTLEFLKEWAEECPTDRAQRGATPEEVSAAEARLGYPLPTDYRAFVVSYGSGAIGLNPVIGLLPCPELSIHQQDIFIANAYYMSEWMDFRDSFVLSVDGLGNVTTMSRDGSVCFNDHEEHKRKVVHMTFEGWLRAVCFGVPL